MVHCMSVKKQFSAYVHLVLYVLCVPCIRCMVACLTYGSSFLLVGSYPQCTCIVCTRCMKELHCEHI